MGSFKTNLIDLQTLSPPRETSPNPEGSATVEMALSTSRASNRRDYRGCR